MVGRRADVPACGDVVWITLTPRVGHEQAGRRPAGQVPENRFASCDDVSGDARPACRSDTHLPVTVSHLPGTGCHPRRSSPSCLRSNMTST